MEMKISVIVPTGETPDKIKGEIFEAALQRQALNTTIITANPVLNTVQVTSTSKDLIEFLSRSYTYTYKHPPIS